MGKRVKRIRVPENLTELAYKAIRESILTGDLGAEDRLSEELLATQLGVSKSPVREALNRLAVEGLIEISPRRGTQVAQFGPEEVTEIFDLRETLEMLAMKRLRVTPELLSDLRSVIERCKTFIETGDRKKFLIEDARFHDLLIQASQNRFLCRTFRNLQDHIQLIRLKSMVLPGRPKRSHQEHREIVMALEQDKLPRVEQLLREHIRAVKDDLLQSMQHAVAGAPAELSGGG